jgi:tetratricopeptide (TPR) repeat protein
MTAADPRLLRAQELYERATFGGDLSALVTAQDEVDGVAADLALARGRLLHARFLADRRADPAELAEFTTAVELYARLGDTSGEAEARFWLGTYHQIVRGDGAAALPELERAYALAEDPMTRSYAARHLGFHAADQGDTATARTRFEESLRLRREVGHGPAIAAALLPLAHLVATTGDREAAEELLAEAEELATASGAAGVLTWLTAVRAELAE